MLSLSYRKRKEDQMSTINFSTLAGTDQQKLETLHMLRANASRKIDRLEQAGSIFNLQKAIDAHEAICYEISKFSK